MQAEGERVRQSETSTGVRPARQLQSHLSVGKSGEAMEIALTPASYLARAAAVALPLLATPADAASFPSVVRTILDSQTEGRIAQMGRDQRARMTDCVISTLSGLPNGKKRYIVEGASLDEQEDRFGEVVQEDRAKWKQKIATACSKIAVEQSSND